MYNGEKYEYLMQKGLSFNKRTGYSVELRWCGTSYDMRKNMRDKLIIKLLQSKQEKKLQENKYTETDELTMHQQMCVQP